MSLNRAMRGGLSALGAFAIATATSAPAAAQEPADPNPSRITVTGGIDFLNTYMFRGIRQDDTGVTTWPYANLGLLVYSGDKGLKTVSLKVGTWNSLHTGNTGSNGPSGCVDSAFPRISPQCSRTSSDPKPGIVGPGPISA